MKKPKKIPLISNLTYLQKVLLLVLCGAVVGAGAYFCYLLRAHTYLGDDSKACINCHIMTPYYSTFRNCLQSGDFAHT